MRNGVINNLQVGIIPSWLYSVVQTLPNFDLERLACFDSVFNMYETDDILTYEDVLAYVALQSELDKLTEQKFSDLYKISGSESNLNFCQKHATDITDYVEASLANRKLKERLRDSDSVSMISDALAREHYTPYLHKGTYLFLIGSTEQVYPDARAFHNALMECVMSGLPYDAVRHTEMFKHYLRNATTAY